MSADRKKMLHERAYLRAEFGDLHEVVSRILYTRDPIEIGFGNNPDEYDAEADTILPRLRDCVSREDVLRVVHEELLRWFDAESVGEPDRYKEIAGEIWEACVALRRHG